MRITVSASVPAGNDAGNVTGQLREATAAGEVPSTGVSRLRDLREPAPRSSGESDPGEFEVVAERGGAVTGDGNVAHR
jgi:hypothetical protein